MKELDAILAQFSADELDALERGKRHVDADEPFTDDAEMEALLKFMELGGVEALGRVAMHEALLTRPRMPPTA